MDTGQPAFIPEPEKSKRPLSQKNDRKSKIDHNGLPAKPHNPPESSPKG